MNYRKLFLSFLNVGSVLAMEDDGAYAEPRDNTLMGHLEVGRLPHVLTGAMYNGYVQGTRIVLANSFDSLDNAKDSAELKRKLYNLAMELAKEGDKPEIIEVVKSFENQTK